MSADKTEKNGVVDGNEAKSESIVFTECASSINELIIDDGEQPSERFAKHYTKLWPFGLLRTLNMVLFIALTALAILSSRYSAFVSGTNVAFLVNYSDWRKSGRLFLVSLGSSLVCFALLFVIKWIGTKKCKNFCAKHLAIIGVVDLAFSLLCVLALLPSLIKFSICGVFALQFALPPLMNGTTTFPELADYLSNNKLYVPPPYHYRPPDYTYRRIHYTGAPTRPTTTTPTTTTTTTMSPYDIMHMEGTKQNAMMLLWLTPLTALVIGLTMLVNLVYAARLFSWLKKSGMWRADYRAAHPNCSKLDSILAKFWPIGLLRIAIWLLPAIALIACLAFIDYPLIDDRLRILLVLSIFSQANFLFWLCYVHRVRLFRPASDEFGKNSEKQQPNQQQQIHQMADFCKMSFYFDLFGLAVYGIFRFFIFRPYRDEEAIQQVLSVGILLYLASLVATVRLLNANGGLLNGGGGYSSLALNLPSISINISVNVNHINGQEEKKMEEEKMECKEEEKKENKAEKGEEPVAIV